MSQDVTKVGAASAIGAAVFCLVALLIAPIFTWYSACCGALVGGLVGYMGYEFRVVLSNIRQMWGWLFRKPERKKQLKRRSFLASTWFTTIMLILAGALFVRPDSPSFSGTILSFGGGVLFALFFLILIFSEMQRVITVAGILEPRTESRPTIQEGRWVFPWGWKIFCSSESFLDYLLFNELRTPLLLSKIRWVEPLDDAEDKRWRQLGIHQLAPTIWNMLRMRLLDFFVAVYLSVGFYFWALLRIPSGLVRLASLIGSLFRRIHSHQRVVCAESSIIGGMLTYTLMGDMSQTLSEKLFLVALGGISGFAVGVLLWKIVLSWRASEVVPTAET